MTIDFPKAAEVAVPFFIAQVATPSFSWQQTLLVYGPLGLWVAWFVIRDRLDREERKQERTDQERRHQENLNASKQIENAFRTNTQSIIVAMMAMKHIDSAFTELLEKLRKENENPAR